MFESCRPRALLYGCSLALGLRLVVAAAQPAAVAPAGLPSSLSDREFWRFVVDASEPNGYFRSDTLTSNELRFQTVIPDLVARRSGAYLGVGPEQNFTYIAAVRPAIAIIFDIRRANLLLQLMYKAIFELTKDRADFVSMLFSKPRPAGLGPASTVDRLFAAFATSRADDQLFTKNLAAIRARLVEGHGLPLAARDLDGIEYVLRAFYQSGFAVRPSPSYQDLMTATDRLGASRSYLASETSFALVKRLESNNLVIPIVGDFGGPKAIRAVATYLKAHASTVSAFYLSNVEQYLYQDGKWPVFCRNVAALPLDPSSTFIRSLAGGGGWGGRFLSSLGAITEEVKNCVNSEPEYPRGTNDSRTAAARE